MISEQTTSQLRYWAMFGLFCSALALWRGLLPLALFIAVSLVWFFSYHLKLGWYILVLLSPMIHWFFRFSDYWYLFTDVPQLLGVYAPVVEFWTAMLIAAFGVAQVRSWLHGRKMHLQAPGIWWFMAFFVSALLSLSALASFEIFSSLYQIVRQLLLFYVGYILLGANILQTKADVFTALKVFLGVSVFAATMGAISFVTGMSYAEFGYVRAIPFAIGNWAPFGYQHIFLGEIITVGLPIALYFWYSAKTVEATQWYRRITVGLLIVALLTLSRAAWLVIGLEACILFLFLHPKRLIEWGKRYIVPLLILGSIAVGYFVYFLVANPNVTSSTNARVLLTEVSAIMVWERPLLGHGFWSFQPYADNTVVIQREIGGGEDAHGFVQKVLAEQGIVGGIAFVGLLTWFVYGPIRLLVRGRRRPYVLLALGMMLSPILFQLFSTQYYTSKMWVPIILGYMLYIVEYKDADKEHFLTRK